MIGRSIALIGARLLKIFKMITLVWNLTGKLTGIGIADFKWPYTLIAKAGEFKILCLRVGISLGLPPFCLTLLVNNLSSNMNTKTIILIQNSPEYAPNNWRDCQQIVGGLESGKKLLPRFQQNNPSSRFRIIERTTTVTDSVIYLPD